MFTGQTRHRNLPTRYVHLTNYNGSFNEPKAMIWQIPWTEEILHRLLTGNYMNTGTMVGLQWDKPSTIAGAGFLRSTMTSNWLVNMCHYVLESFTKSEWKCTVMGLWCDIWWYLGWPPGAILIRVCSPILSRCSALEYQHKRQVLNKLHIDHKSKKWLAFFIQSVP